MGYRFLGDVKKLEDRFTEEKADPPHDLTGSISPVIGLDESATIDNGDKSSSGNRMRRNSKLVIASIAATIVIAVSGGYLIRGMVHTRTEAASSHPVGMNSHLRIVPLTSLPGAAGDPSLSPDGQQVAFFWNGEAPAKWNLYVQLVGGEKPLQLTHFNDGFLCCADWSPDGREIIFGRCDDTGGAVFMIPALGGAERKLTTVVCSYARSGHSRWTADGKSLVLTDSCTPGCRPGIVLFSLATGEKKCLHAPPAGGVGDSWPAPSPDGTTIAFTESPNAQMSELHTVEVSGNNLRQLTHDGAGMCQRPMWSPDGKHIAFESSRSGFSRVWRIAASGGPIELDTTYPSVGSLSRDGRRLAYDESGGFSGGPEVWRVQLASAGGKVVSETSVLASGGGNMGTQLSPDERQIAFHSGRSGSYQIWKSDTDGANPLQLTFFNLGAPGTPRWSPD
jgi:Tol biopolymer transport system component